jgi:phosphotransferase system enzyme I (PtsP)
LSYFPIEEDNPFLGWRGIRISLDHPELFLAQIRAMLRASRGFNNLNILLPMITNVNEFDEAKALIDEAIEEVNAEKGTAVMRPHIGAMIEVPSAVYQARVLAQRADFLSIGSNDLTQYLLAVDRNNTRVSSLYDAYHPAVLYALHMIVRAARLENTPVCLCGELAGDPLATVLLIAMGFDSLSASPGNLPRVKWIIRHLTMDKAREILWRVMKNDNPKTIRAELKEALEKAGLSELVRAGV